MFGITAFSEAPFSSLASFPQELTQTARFDNTNTFYATDLNATYDLFPSRIESTNTFYAADLAASITLAQTARYDNTNSFYAALLEARIDLTQATRYDNLNVYFNAVVAGGSPTPIPYHPGCQREDLAVAELPREAMVVKELPRNTMQPGC